MTKISLVLVLLGVLGCGSGGEGSPDSGAPKACEVANTDVVAYQDCKTTTAEGFACVENCGRLPADGGLGTLLGNGCTVQIGTSTPVTGLCVASCEDCGK